jgi:hypothetical protein
MNAVPKPERKKREKKKKLKSLGKLKQDAQILVNAFVRTRDSKDGFFQCISCGKILTIDKMNAGHFIAVGQSSFLRYYLQNINGQCSGCNNFKHGNLIEYRMGLVQKIGEEGVDYLECNRHTLKKWTRDELQEIIDYFSGVKS